jgi:hypothetical protein
MVLVSGLSSMISPWIVDHYWPGHDEISADLAGNELFVHQRQWSTPRWKWLGLGFQRRH